MRALDDKRIIELYLARDDQAIVETQTSYGRLIYSVARNILWDEGECEECESDTYLRAWNSIPPTIPEILSAFLAKITRNLALNRLRDRKRRLDVELIYDELAEAIPDTSGELCDDIALRDAFNDFISSLDKTKRRIFVKRYFYMCSVREIARDIGATEGSIKVSLSRTRQMLRQYLTERGIVI